MQKHIYRQGIWCKNPTLVQVIGAVFLILGIVIVSLMTIEQFSCQRAEGYCAFSERHIWESEFREKSKLPISDIRSAQVDSKVSEIIHNRRGGKKRTTVYLVNLHTRTGVRQLFGTASDNRSMHEQQARQINAFLKNGVDQITITEEWFMFSVPIAFIIMGLLMIAVARIAKKHVQAKFPKIVER